MGADGWVTHAPANTKPAVFWSNRDDASTITPTLATHFTASGASVGSGLVFGQSPEPTELEMVRTKPFPFPPEPMRWAAVELTPAAIRRADQRRGKRGLGLLDRFRVGFDS